MEGLQYAMAGDTHVAYRVLGGGDRDLVMLSGGVFPIELLPEDHVAARLLDGLASLGRLVIFDRRGIGLSDPIVDWDRPLLDQWCDDLGAVIHAAGLDRPVVVSWEWSGIAAHFAGTRPDALSALVLFEPYLPAHLLAPDVRASFTDAVVADIRGEGDLIERTMPSRIREPAFREWLDRRGARVGVGPARGGGGRAHLR